MNKRKNYLALDFRPGGGKAVSGAFDGDKLAVETIHAFPVESADMLGIGYWDFPAMMLHAARGLAAHAARHGPELAGVAVDAWGADFGLLDGTGQLLANPVRSGPDTPAGLFDKFRAAVPPRELYRRSGVVARRNGALFRLFAMVKSGSPLPGCAGKMLLMADLVAHFLSGEPVAEYTLATTTGFYDAGSREWAGDVLAGIGVPAGILPEIVAPGTVIGPMLDRVTGACGLGEVPVIASAGHAPASAAAAAPAKGDDWFYIVTDGENQLGAEIPGPILGEDAFSGGFSNEGGVDGSFRLARDLTGLDLLRRCIAVWSRQDGVMLEIPAMIELAEAAQPMARLVNPDDPRLANAADAPAALAEFLAATGQPPAATRSDLVRTCLDSLVLSHRHALRQLSEITGKTYRVAHVLGWDCRIELLCQAFADAAGVSVRAGPLEAPAIGNIVTQALALGDVGSLEEAREVAAKSFPVQSYEPRGDAGAWNEAYRRFVRLL